MNPPRLTLRPYQRAAIDALYAYFAQHTGNPLVVLPTGAGKSLVLAAFCREAIEAYPTTRIVVLTHVKELIEQDVRALLRYWPEAPVGIWSAGLGATVKAQVTVAGIQSVHRRPGTFAGTDLVIIDEAHLLSKNSDTMYGRFLAGLRGYNPALRVIGLTATPYRTDSGLLTDGANRVFTDIAYEARVGDLIKDGYLCPLVARRGATVADLTGVHTRGGEYVADELQAAMNHDHLIVGALREIEQLAHDRQHILAFCAGIEHAARCAEVARSRGLAADHVTGEMPGPVRDARIQAFLAGRTRILFNAQLLTTGFDFPAIDAIALLRPTKSTGLYVQMLGRGLRRHDQKANTLVLDFAGNVERHGPIDQIRIKRPGAPGEGVSVAPVKECPACHSLIHTAARVCPECEHVFPESAAHGTTAADAVVVAALEAPRACLVDRVTYQRHQKAGKAPTLKVTYWSGISTYDEWVPLEDSRDFVRKHAVRWFWERGLVCPATVDQALAMVPKIPAPDIITVKLDGRYWRVLDIDLGDGRLNVSTVVERERAFWEQVA